MKSKLMSPSKTKDFSILFFKPKLDFGREWHHFYELAWLRSPLEPLGSPGLQDPSQMPPRCLPGACQMPSRCFTNPKTSQMPPKLSRDPLGFLFSKKKMPNHKNLLKATKNSLKWKSVFSWKVEITLVKVNEIDNFWWKAGNQRINVWSFST